MKAIILLRIPVVNCRKPISLNSKDLLACVIRIWNMTGCRAQGRPPGLPVSSLLLSQLPVLSWKVGYHLRFRWKANSFPCVQSHARSGPCSFSLISAPFHPQQCAPATLAILCPRGLCSFVLLQATYMSRGLPVECFSHLPFPSVLS